jgi:hypothetical protein
LYTILFSVFRSKSCNLMSSTRKTFQHMLMDSHLSYSAFFCHWCIALPILIWIILNLI